MLSHPCQDIFLDLELEADVSVFAEIAVNRPFITVSKKNPENSLCCLLVVRAVKRKCSAGKPLVSELSFLPQVGNRLRHVFFLPNV